MAWTKSPPELVALLDWLAPKDSGVQKRQMFGYPALFVRGRFAAGLFQHDLVLRLNDVQRAWAASDLGARPFEPTPGRTMRGFVVVEALKVRPEKLGPWVQRAVDHAAMLPPKAAPGAKPKAARPKAATKAPPKKAAVKAKKAPPTPSKRAAPKRKPKTDAKTGAKAAKRLR